MKRLAVILVVIAVTSGCGRWSDKRGWEGFQEDLQHRDLNGKAQVTPSSDETLAKTITYTVAARDQQTQVVTVLEFRHLDDAIRRFDTLKLGEQTNYAARNGYLVMTCEFTPQDTNRAAEVRRIFGHHRR